MTARHRIAAALALGIMVAGTLPAHGAGATTITPGCAGIGAAVTISGRKLRGTQTTVGGVRAQVIRRDRAGQTFIVPAGVAPGPASVVVSSRKRRRAEAMLRIQGAELCNGVDDDCNGLVDDGVPDRLVGATVERCEGGRLVATGPRQGEDACVPGVIEACYHGPAGTEGVGACVAGARICDPDGFFGACGGQVVPDVDDPGNGLDEDCDGQDGPGGGELCTPGAFAPCYTGPPATRGVGLCRPGMRMCAPDGFFGPCDGEVRPAPEILDNTADEDCDGTVGRTDTPFELAVDPAISPTFQSSQVISGEVGTEPGPPPPPPTPALLASLAPTRGRQAETLDVIVTGRDTTFTAGTSQVTFGPGVTVNTVVVQDALHVRVNVSIAADAGIGPRLVSVSTGRQEAILPNAFDVVAGEGSVKGRLVDADGRPVAGATVCVQGTSICTVTDANGEYTLTGVPTTATRILIEASGFEALSLPIGVPIGGTSEAGQTALAPPRDPPPPPPPAGKQLPPELASILGRNVGDLSGGMPLRKARKLISDTILALGGPEAGVRDAEGRQLNPEVAGAGVVTLTDAGIRLLAEDMQQGASLSLGEMLYAFSFGFEWSEGAPITLAEWIAGIQELVDAAWENPADPENQLAVVLFNQGRTILENPPTIAPEMRLNPIQAYVLFTSLYAYIVNPGPGDDTPPPATLPARVARQAGHRPYTRFWRNFFGARTNFATQLVNESAFAYVSLVTAFTIKGLAYATFGPVAGVLNKIAEPIEGQLLDAMVKRFRLLTFAQLVPEPPKIRRAEVVRDDDGKARVEVEFGKAVSDKGFAGHVYALYRFRNLDAERELIGFVRSNGEESFVLTDPAPLPLERSPAGDLLPAPSFTWFYAVTLTRLLRSDQLVDAATLDQAVPWWTFPNNSGQSSLAQFFRRTTQPIVSDYSEPQVVTITSEPPIDVDAIEVDPRNDDIYYSNTTTDNLVKVDIGFDREDRSVFAATGFKEPGQTGLGIDAQGTLYTDNAASDAQFGGRIFRFSQPDGARDFTGSLNKFSRILFYANPVAAGVMSIGPGSLPAVSAEDLFVVDRLVQSVKRVPVNATFDPFSRIGQPWASIPFNANDVDLEFDDPGNGYLLVQRVASAGLAARLTVDQTEVVKHRTFQVTMTASSLSGRGATGVAPAGLTPVGDAGVALVSGPTPASANLAGDGTEQAYVFVFRATRPGIVSFRGRAEGLDASGATIQSPEVSSPNVTVLSTLGLTLVATPDFVSPGGTIDLAASVRNRGDNPVVNVTLAPISPRGDGTASVSGGPTPASIDLAPNEVKTIAFTVRADAVGRVDFGSQASGTDAVTSATEDSNPSRSNLVTISTLRVEAALDTDEPVVIDGPMVVTVRVTNIGRTRVVGVTPELRRSVGGNGRFLITLEPTTTADLAPGGSTTFRYELRADASGGVVLEAGAFGTDPDTNARVVARGVRLDASVGPTIVGRLIDVLLDLPTSPVPGQPPGTRLPSIGRVIDDRTTAPVPRVMPITAIDADGNRFTAMSDNEGKYRLGVKRPGIYTVEAVHAETNVGQRYRIEIPGPEDAVPRDIVLPVSLVKRAQELIEELTTIRHSIVDVELVTCTLPLPPEYCRATVQFGYRDAVGPLQTYLDFFRRGVNTPEWKGVYRGVGRPTEWDGLVRLSTTMAFARRRAQETVRLAQLAIRTVLIPALTHDLFAKGVLQKIDKKNIIPQAKVTGLERINAKLLKVSSLVTLFMFDTITKQLQQAGFDLGAISDQRYADLRNAVTTFLFKAIRFGFGFFTGQIQGDLVFEAIFIGGQVFGTQSIMQDYYIDFLTQPMLLQALDRARSVQLSDEDTVSVLTRLADLDEASTDKMDFALRAFSSAILDESLVRGAAGIGGLVDARQSVITKSNVETFLSRFEQAAKKVIGFCFSAISLASSSQALVLQPGRVCKAIRLAFESDRFDSSQPDSAGALLECVVDGPFFQ